MNVFVLYTNITNGEGLVSLRKFLETRDNKKISSDAVARPAEVVLKNIIFEFDEKTFRKKSGTAIETKFEPLYTIPLIADLEEKMLETFEKKLMIWWRYIDDIFHLGTC